MESKASESYLLFRLQEELFAVSVHKVLEIIEIGDEHIITHLPKAPSSVSGVVNFRGNVIPVVDTRIKFDLERYNPEDKYVVIVLKLLVNNVEHIIGAMSDKVEDVIEISEKNIKSIPEIGKGYNTDYIDGVINRGNQFVMLINLEEAISNEEIVSLKTEEVMEDVD